MGDHLNERGGLGIDYVIEPVSHGDNAGDGDRNVEMVLRNCQP